MQLRSMLRFTIRDVLWLTLVVGLVVGWDIESRHDAEQIDQWKSRAVSLAKECNRHGWEVEWAQRGVRVNSQPSAPPMLPAQP